jgi:membrane protein insertase Oxa1/YidC/SpoIIIJ
MKTIAIAAALLGLAFTSSAFADEMKCDDASMKMMQGEMEKMDAAMKDKKEMAMKEMEMAMASMKDGKSDDCMMHMKGAMDAMKK